MDPDANLKEQRELAVSLLEDGVGTDNAHDAERLCELVLALDVWIAGGGSLPVRWRKT